MSKSRSNQISLPVKLSKQKHVQVQVKMPRQGPSLDKMDHDQLQKEISGLPERIAQARQIRDKLFSKLRERWSGAYANDTEFITAYARAEAAGQEVVYLLTRLVKASGLYNERYGRKLL